MLSYIFLGTAILILFVLIRNGRKPKTERNTNPNDSVPTSEFIKRTEERIASSNALLAEIRANEGNDTVNESEEGDLYTGGYGEFELSGVHIPKRKKYILNYCAENDAVELTHEKNNSYSDKAIVVTHNGAEIGYIAAHDLDEVHEIISNPFTSHITAIDFDGSYLAVYIALDYEDKAFCV